MMTYTVYRATNTINSKSYVGVDSNWPSARMAHESARGDSDIFHRALRQYGPQLFRWEALLHTENMDEANELVSSLYKSTLAPAGYNTHATLVTGLNGTSAADFKVNLWPVVELAPGETPTGGIDAETELREVMKLDLKDMSADKADEVIQEAKEKIRKGQLTEEGRKKIKEAVSRPVSIDGIMYSSITEASEKLKLPRHQVKMVIKGTNSVEYYRKKNAEEKAGK